MWLFRRRKKRAQIVIISDGDCESYRRSEQPGDVDNSGVITISSVGWAGEIWDENPIRVPQSLDVAAFMDQRPMPYVWPDNKGYREHVDSMDDPLAWLLLSWVGVFLHHPDSVIVIQCMQLPLSNFPLHTVTIADLLVLDAEQEVREEAARAVWRFDDDGVRMVFNTLFSRGVPSDYPDHLLRGAIDLLRSTCPFDRAELLKDELSYG